MGVPLSQMWTVASYVIKQKMQRRGRYPLVLMLEPLFRCNLACAGCGKIQHPTETLRRHLSPEACFRAAFSLTLPHLEPYLIRTFRRVEQRIDGLRFDLLTNQLIDANVNLNVFETNPLLIARMDQLARNPILSAQLDDAHFERLYTKLIRFVSQGRLLRGSKQGVLIVERPDRGGQAPVAC